MEKINDMERQRPGFIVESYKDVKPEEVDNFRKQAALFLSEREFTKEELMQINSAEESTLVEHEFKGGLQLTRMNFESGAIMEVYRSEYDRFRIIYDPNAQTVKTQREPRNQPLL